MPHTTDLNRQILRHVKENPTPNSLPVEFGRKTTIGDHDASTVRQRVERLSKDGFVTLNADVSANGSPDLIIVRGLTQKGEQLLEESA